MMDRYEPTAADIAVCNSVGEWHGTPDQRATVRRHADTIETPAPDDDDEMRAARQWVLDQDDAGNSAPFLALQKYRYVFGDTGHTGALAYLVDVVQYRRAEKARNAEMLRMYREAMAVTEWRYCFNCGASHTHKRTARGWKCGNCEFTDTEEGRCSS